MQFDSDPPSAYKGAWMKNNMLIACQLYTGFPGIMLVYMYFAILLRYVENVTSGILDTLRLCS